MSPGEVTGTISWGIQSIWANVETYSYEQIFEWNPVLGRY